VPGVLRRWRFDGGAGGLRASGRKMVGEASSPRDNEQSLSRWSAGLPADADDTRMSVCHSARPGHRPRHQSAHI